MKGAITFDHYERARLKKVASLCRPGSVLDIGYAQYPNPYFTGLHRTGIDLEASRGGTAYEEELVGDATRLADILNGRSFDTVVAGEFIEHVEQPYEFLRSLRPFVKPCGRLVITTPNPVSWPCVFFEWGRSQRFYYTRQHLYYFTPRWVERMLDISGYRVEVVRGVGLLLPWIIPPCPAGLSYQVVIAAAPRAGDQG